MKATDWKDSWKDRGPIFQLRAVTLPGLLLGIPVGAAVPVATFCLSHLDLVVDTLGLQIAVQNEFPPEVYQWSRWGLVIAGLAYSAPKVWHWMQLITGPWAAAGWVVLIEGFMVAGPIPALSAVVLGILIVINALAASSSFSMRDRFDRAQEAVLKRQESVGDSLLLESDPSEEREGERQRRGLLQDRGAALPGRDHSLAPRTAWSQSVGGVAAAGDPGLDGVGVEPEHERAPVQAPRVLPARAADTLSTKPVTVRRKRKGPEEELARARQFAEGRGVCSIELLKSGLNVGWDKAKALFARLKQEGCFGELRPDGRWEVIQSMHDEGLPS